MSPSHTDHERETQPLDTRLRLDPNTIGEARWYLAEIDRAVFASAGGHGADRHASLVKGAVMALFGRG